jgi:hypothetical protein
VEVINLFLGTLIGTYQLVLEPSYPNLHHSKQSSNPSIHSLKNCPKSVVILETTALAAKQPHTVAPPIPLYRWILHSSTIISSSQFHIFLCGSTIAKRRVLSSFGSEQKKKKKDNLGRTFHHSSYCTSFYTSTLQTRFLFKGGRMIGFIGLNIHLIIMG